MQRPEKMTIDGSYFLSELFSRFRRFRLSAFQMIILGFATVILTGTLLLLLPSARTGEAVSFTDALFTATSAVCVTGLVTKNTVTFWSRFGQAVILCLIQIGGLGIASLTVAVALIRQKKIGLSQRILMQTSISQNKVGGIVVMTRFIFKLVFLTEFVGAVLLSAAFIPEFGVLRGIWYSLFHSVSAFCNAGFDLMGTEAPFVSLTAYADNAYVSGIIMLLIILGGIGFMTWHDVLRHKYRIHRYCLQSKIILLMTAVLIALPTLFFFLTDFQEMPVKQRLLVSLFQAVTPRTAGFNTVDLADMSESSRLLVIILMMIGGAPGSTAGGMKVTTIYVLFALFPEVFTRGSRIESFGRSIPDSVLRQATAIILLYLLSLLFGGMYISAVEHAPLMDSLFETASALGTVGLSLGMTPSLETASKLLLIFYMFLGRVGGLTLAYAVVFRARDKRTGSYPAEDVAVG